MTDNRTTELLREGLTEHGIEWRSGLKGVTFVGDWCFVEYGNGNLAATCEPVLTPEQAIAATLGSEKQHEHPFVGLVRGEYRERIENSDYYCGRCGYPVTDHDSYCRECGGAFHESAATLGSEREKALEKLESKLEAEAQHAREGWELAMANENRIAELIRCLENDWHIHASWDGLRRFWNIGLTEEGVRLRDELNARAERTCHDIWDTELTGRLRFQCSECKAVSLEITPRYCPSCGARHTWWPDSLPNFCPTCGNKVKAVKR